MKKRRKEIETKMVTGLSLVMTVHVIRWEPIESRSRLLFLTHTNKRMNRAEDPLIVGAVYWQTTFTRINWSSIHDYTILCIVLSIRLPVRQNALAFSTFWLCGLFFVANVFTRVDLCVHPPRRFVRRIFELRAFFCVTVRVQSYATILPFIRPCFVP